MTTSSAILAIVRYQLVWLAFVISAGYGMWWPGMLAAAIVVAIQLARSTNRGLELLAFGGALLVALVAELIFASFTTMRYAAHWPGGLFAPLWIFGLWLALATAIPATRFLLGAHAVAKSILLGLVFGPLAYIGSAQNEAITIGAPYWQNVAIIGIVWAVAFPAMVLIYERLFPKSGRAQT